MHAEFKNNKLPLFYCDYRFEILYVVVGALGNAPSWLVNYMSVLGFEKEKL